MGNVNIIKNIVFDFDGVIENTYDFCYKIEKQRNTNLTHKQFQNMYTSNYWKKVDSKYITEKSIQEYELQYKKEIEKRKTLPKIKQTLQKLSKKYNLFIISSCSEENIKLYLQNNNINYLFTKILGKESNHSKIKKFQLLFQNYNTQADRYIFITDTLGDIIEANHLNIQTIATTSGYHKQKILKKGNPHKIINNLTQLEKYFQLSPSINTEQTPKKI